MPRLRPPGLELGLDHPQVDAVAELRNIAIRRKSVITGRREEEERVGISIERWAVDRVPEPRTGRINLERFPFQREMLYSSAAVEDREQVIQKGTQIGASTGTIRQAFFHADIAGRVVIYTFPTKEDLGDFSRERIGPLIRRSDYLRTRMEGSDVDRVDQKQVGLGWVYFRGTNNPIESIPADVLLLDEYDYSNQANIEASERRVSGPFSAGIIRRVGVPTFPHFGISARYEESDQRVWTVKCGACATWNPIEGPDAFEHNIDLEQAMVVCRDCRRPLDVRVGEWVARHPDRDIRGYHAPKLIVHGANLRRVVANSRKGDADSQEAFVQRDLGKGFTAAGRRLTREQLQACVRRDLRLHSDLRSPRLTVMGIDQASARPLSVVIEDSVDEYTSRVVWAGRVEDQHGGLTAFEQLCSLMDRFNVNIAGIDNAPDGRMALAFQARYPGRVFRVSYFEPQPQAKRDPDVWNVDEAEGFVSVWRARIMEITLQQFMLQRRLLPPEELLPKGYFDELGSPVRQTETVGARRAASESGKRAQAMQGGYERVVYVKTGPDDFAHSHVYALIAGELFWRIAGTREALQAPPRPLAEGTGYERSHLSDYQHEADYDPGPSDDYGDDPSSPEFYGLG